MLILGTVLAGGILWLASGGSFNKKYTLYLAVIEESVAGLNLNAPVKYNGVDVGQVRDIQLAPGNPERVNLLFAIDDGTLIKEDTVAVLKTQGLTGIAYVELSGGAPGAKPLRASKHEKYPVIKTMPSLGARLENVLTTVLSKLDSTSGRINDILSEKNLAAFESALTDISSVAHTLAERQEDLNDGIASAARTFANTADATVRLDNVIKQIGTSAAAVENMGNQTAMASISASATINNVGMDVRRFTGETLPELERLLGELSVLSNSLRRLSEQTQRNPAGLLFGRMAVPEGPGETSSGESE